MKVWEVETPNTVTVVTKKVLSLKAFYIVENDKTGNYTEMLGTFNRVGDRYVLNHTFSLIENYIIKISETNGLIPDQYVKISVRNQNLDFQNRLNAYQNKDLWKGLNAIQNSSIVDTNTQVNSLVTTLSNVSNTVNTLPTLSQIEGSNVLSKGAIIESMLANIPVLSEIRNEFINVNFGGLEIINNQLILKDKAGVIIAIFDLFDNNGIPTVSNVFKRVVVQ